MLQPWTEASTWNDFNSGIANDGIEARAEVSLIIPRAAGGVRTFDVTADVQAWADGAPNYGWAFLSTGRDGVSFDSSEHQTNAARPTLLVDWFPPPPPCRIVRQPPSSITIDEGQTLQISIVAPGCPPAFQWTKNSVAIPGANSSTYFKTNANPNDNGTYRCTVDNDFGPAITSDSCTVTVNPFIRPWVTITHNRGENTIMISWSPNVGRLRESSDLVSWTDSTRQNGVAFTSPGELRFYRVER